MKRPWQIWLWWLLCLAIVLPAMGWLTVKALELDRAEAAARRDAEVARWQADAARELAEQQELVNSALWRMDWTLTPLIAQEAARPYFVYWPFYPSQADRPDSEGKTSGAKGASQPAPVDSTFPSPLLMQPSEYVLLHFQLTPDEHWTSPQTPADSLQPVAMANGVSVDNMRLSEGRLRELSDAVSYAELVERLPDQWLPAFDPQAARLAMNLSINYNGQLLDANSPNQAVEPSTVLPPLQQRTQQPAAPQSNSPQPAEVPQQAAISQTYGNGLVNANDLPQLDASQQPTGVNLDDYLGGYAANAREQAKRGETEFQRRTRALNSFAQSQIVQQRLVNDDVTFDASQVVREGVTRPVWIGSRLLLARRVSYGEQTLVQGCWLDWERLKQMLLAEVADLLPNAELTPVLDETLATPGRALATLPVRIAAVTDERPLPNRLVTATDGSRPSVAVEAWSPIQLSLLAAWGCLLVAMSAVGALLFGVVSLSERRGAFVSAVTHELRTPLTTFRMYAEMLAENMVPSAEQRQRYLETLRAEADRLAHLVENVLAYARLERGRHGTRLETLSVDELLDRIAPRLADRANQVEMNLVVEIEESAGQRTLHTDPTALEQILFNLVDNACKYAARAEDRRIHLRVETASDRELNFRVIDYGPGIARDQAKRLFRPFSKSDQEAARTAPGVGLGLALSRRLARILGGRLEMGSDRPSGVGAEFVLSLPISH